MSVKIFLLVIDHQWWTCGVLDYNNFGINANCNGCIALPCIDPASGHLSYFLSFLETGCSEVNLRLSYPLWSRARFSGASGGSRADSEASRGARDPPLAPENLARYPNGELTRKLLGNVV